MRLNSIKFIILMAAISIVTGCASAENAANSDEADNSVAIVLAETSAPVIQGPLEQEIDYSEEFEGIQGCAVVYLPETEEYFLYNKAMCDVRESPYSSFKIVSALIGLDAEIIDSDSSTMNYDGTTYPVEAWNGNLTLQEAFASSCIWYFSQIIDCTGQDNVQAVLDELNYGNCDISEWDGSGINPLPELNGFWLASSLKISPREQVEVLSRIFEGKTEFEQNDIKILKSVMRTEATDSLVTYGKTGSSGDGQAWFVGFAEQENHRSYIAVYLNDRLNADKATGSQAKDIAIAILNKL